MPTFETSVFINCPFDNDYAPTLQAIAFCIVDIGLHPRLAPENADNAVPRLDRIIGLIRSSKFGIHDLSRSRAVNAGDFARMNMPFELGLDHAAQRFGDGDLRTKQLLVLENERYEYQRVLSDIAGWDIAAHSNDHLIAVRIVRDWLARILPFDVPRKGRILGHYMQFQEWYWERELAQGALEDDIKAYPTNELIDAMRLWKIESGA